MEIIKGEDISKIKDMNYMGNYIKICNTLEAETNFINKLSELGRSSLGLILEIEEGLKILSRKIKDDCNIITHSYDNLLNKYSIVILNEDDYLNLKDDR